jgi:hypothetical protein
MLRPLTLCLLWASALAQFYPQPDRPGPWVTATKGSVWPQPQQQTNGENLFILDPETFAFNVGSKLLFRNLIACIILVKLGNPHFSNLRVPKWGEFLYARMLKYYMHAKCLVLGGFLSEEESYVYTGKMHYQLLCVRQFGIGVCRYALHSLTFILAAVEHGCGGMSARGLLTAALSCEGVPGHAHSTRSRHQVGHEAAAV